MLTLAPFIWFYYCMFTYLNIYISSKPIQKHENGNKTNIDKDMNGEIIHIYISTGIEYE